MIFLKNKILFGVLMLFSLPSLLSASELRLDASKLEIKSGDEFVISLNLQADESINALEGQIVFPFEGLELSEIREGNSSINLWVEKPHLVEPGLLSFSGLTPGGINGPNNHVFSLVFAGKKEGLASLELRNTKALRNDGLGLETDLKIYNAVVTVEAGDSNLHQEILKDTEPPESFNPIIAQQSALFDNKHFVVFATNDKGVGLKGFEFKEYRMEIFRYFSKWHEAESPQVLRDQKLRSFVLVRAVDQAGNVRVERIVPKYPLTSSEKIIYWVIIMAGISGIFLVSKKMFKLIKKNVH